VVVDKLTDDSMTIGDDAFGLFRKKVAVEGTSASDESAKHSFFTVVESAPRVLLQESSCMQTNHSATTVPDLLWQFELLSDKWGRHHTTPIFADDARWQVRTNEMLVDVGSVSYDLTMHNRSKRKKRTGLPRGFSLQAHANSMSANNPQTLSFLS
jgi:hypothetical protein